MNILETRLNDKGKSWRHVLKSLQVLEYCLIHGSEATAQWCKTNIHYIRTLKQFDHTEDGLDVGANGEPFYCVFILGIVFAILTRPK